MGYGQDFRGTFAFKTAHHLEAGLDAMAHYLATQEGGSFVEPADFERATSRRLNLEMDVYGPASMYFTTVSALLQVAEHASSGYICADFEGDPPEYLHAYGPQSDLPDRHRGYDLYHAATTGDLKGVRTALKHGADHAFSLQPGHTPLMGAVRSDHVEIVRVLLDAGAESLGWERWWSTMHLARSAAMVDALHDAGVPLDVTYDGMQGFPPLAGVCQDGHREAALRLIERGASLVHVDAQARVLQEAARSGILEVLAFVRHQADALSHEALDHALGHAVSGSHHACVRWLLDHGARVSDPETMTSRLCNGGDIALIDLLETHIPEERRAPNAEDNVMARLAGQGHLDTLQHLYDKGWPVIPPVASDHAPLWAAVTSKQADVIVWLLEHGCDPHDAIEDGETPLSWARELGDTAIVRLLEAHGRRARTCRPKEAALRYMGKKQKDPES